MHPVRSSQRVTVGLIAVILPFVGLGWLGIHKFVMGYQKEGVISILGSVCTCFLGSIVFSALSVAEGIIFLTMTDEEFERRYVQNYKPWL